MVSGHVVLRNTDKLYLKERKPDCHVICVEPPESRGMLGADKSLHGLVGMSGMPLALLEKLQPDYGFDGGRCGPVDEFLHCSTPDCIAMANRCAAGEGLMVAPSSGAVINVGVQVARRPDMTGKNIVVLQASSPFDMSSIRCGRQSGPRLKQLCLSHLIWTQSALSFDGRPKTMHLLPQSSCPHNNQL